MTRTVETMFSLTGKVALVAGASSGIGAQFAGALARAGADVVLGARREDRVKALADEISGETGRRTLAVALDVTDGDSVRAAFDQAQSALGLPDVVCNNAGLAVPEWAVDSTEDAWDITMDTNLKGMWRVATEAARRLRDAGQSGSIINTASILGLGVAPMQMTYAVSKAGVVQMTRAMALEFQRFGIRVNALCPGYFKTEINDTFLDSERGKAMVAKTPAGRVGELHELEAPMLMLASDAASFVTGVALPVDGAHSAALI
ncbi:SDR family NAD(P)-dependent oxidoreductase [Yunchengibacter salinarum]|uniref:SDR family NAD(P)-dependent oxidoreductase n=1 Tax=Yunchengibacter salinarum TaxID=3133399 RepID=UPI0035B5929A